MASRARKVSGAFEKRTPVRRINHFPLDSVVCFVNTYPLDSDLTSGQRYPAFEQPARRKTSPIAVTLNKVLARPKNISEV